MNYSNIVLTKRPIVISNPKTQVETETPNRREHFDYPDGAFQLPVDWQTGYRVPLACQPDLSNSRNQWII